MQLTFNNGFVYVLKPGDHQAGADGESFKMSLFSLATILFQFAAITGDAVLKIYSGASAGTKTTSLPFSYRLTGADQGAADADQLGAASTSVAATGLTLTAATYDNRVLAVEIRARQLPDGEPWVTVELDAAASALNGTVVAVLSGSRYQGETAPTAVV